MINMVSASSRNPFLSVVIPAFNEEKNVKKLIEQIETVFINHKINGEIIFVNDNSTDNTSKIAHELRKIYSNLTVIDRTDGLNGPGRTQREGFKHVRGKIIITMDSDLSHDPREIPKFLRAITTTDIVCGSRYGLEGKAEMSFFRTLISKSYNFIFKSLLGIPVNDLTSGYRAYRYELIKSLELSSPGFGIYVEIPIKAYLKGYKFGEVPIYYHPRKKGKSKLSYISQGPEYIKVILHGLLHKTKSAISAT
jgi:dolichol-phosphate mannosyltransferase